jgi:aryl-alcohol dehydrogenase
MQIRAAVVRSSDGPMMLETLELEAPRAGEVLVEVAAVGICHTDMGMWKQELPTPQPVVLGHEGSGIVTAIGAGVTKVKPGDRVAMTFNTCGHCPSCVEHEISYCHEFFPRNFFGTRADGTTGLSRDGEPVHANIFGQSSFASHALCHERNVVVLPDAMPLELAGPLGCGILTGAGAVMNALKVKPMRSIAILGAGSVGLSAVIAAKLAGAGQIIVIDRNLERLELARQLGATHTIALETAELGDAKVREILPAGVDYALDCTGVPALIAQAVAMLAPRGVCGIVGASAMGSRLDVDLVHVMSGGRSVRGIVEGDANPDAFIPLLANLYLKGQFPFDKLVRFYSFDDINQAFADAADGRTIKPILRMSSN